MTLQLADDRGSKPNPARSWTHTVHHGGRAFIASAAMASIFESRAADAVKRGETELVPLLHRGGVDLLLVTPNTRYAVVSIELGVTGGRVHASRGMEPRVITAHRSELRAIESLAGDQLVIDLGPAELQA